MPRPLLILLASLALMGCNGLSERTGGGLLATSQQAPALSGSGEWLPGVEASRVDSGVGGVEWLEWLELKLKVLKRRVLEEDILAVIIDE